MATAGPARKGFRRAGETPGRHPWRPGVHRGFSAQRRGRLSGGGADITNGAAMSVFERNGHGGHDRHGARRLRSPFAYFRRSPFQSLLIGSKGCAAGSTTVFWACTIFHSHAKPSQTFTTYSAAVRNRRRSASPRITRLSNNPASEIPFLKLISAPAEASKESRAWRSADHGEARSGQRLERGGHARARTNGRAPRRRGSRSARIAPLSSAMLSSNQAPSSVRVMVVVCAL